MTPGIHISLSESIAGLDLGDLDLLHLLLPITTVAGEVFASGLIPSFVDIWNFLPYSFGLVANICISIAVLIRVIATLCSCLVLVLDAHYEFLLFSGGVFG